MIRNVERYCWRLLERVSPKGHVFLFERQRVVRFIIAGGLAVLVDVGTLYVAKGICGLSLIPAVAVAFFFGFWASFFLQKFWVFEDGSVDRVHAQVGFYFMVAATNFFLTILLMYFLVEIIHLWYILAKLLVSAAIAFGSFFVYKLLIFKKLP